LLSSASEVLEGKVREIAPMADPATRTFRVRVTLDSLPASARLGMTAAVQINSLISQPHVRLPLTALFQKDRQPAVWVLAPGSEHVRLRSVKVGVLATDTFSVIDGLVPGEEVVTAGVHRLDEQQKVQVWGGRLP
jgi:multidrug efflux system membrane fusion protein